MPTALVAGVLAGKAGNGGNAWTRLSIVLGLRRLGLDVFFLEQLAAESSGTAYFSETCSRFGIDGHLVGDPPSPQLIDRVASADLLLNIGGHLTSPALKRSARVRVYIDDDPGYTQLWLAKGLIGSKVEGHHFYYTFGANVGTPSCTLPTGGYEWRSLRPPVVLEEWPAVDGHVEDRFTTVASWRGGYGRVEANGHLYAQKAHEFRRFVKLPDLTGSNFEIALDIQPADAADGDLLRRHNWRLVDPTRVAATPDDFRSYVQQSPAEFSVAQGIYVETRSGWFSDRTTRYLASGKPALVQDTGFSPSLPIREGLVVFADVDGAVAGVRAIQRDYETHAAAARAIAVEHFDSDKVLGRLLDEVGL